MYNEAQSLLKVKSSAIMDLVGAKVYVVSSRAYVILSEVVSWPLLSCFNRGNGVGIYWKNLGEITI